MKPQDLLFLLGIMVCLAFYIETKKNYLTHLGMICFVLAIPLFAKWIFFTAERLVSYGLAFILIAVIVEMIKLKYEKE